MGKIFRTIIDNVTQLPAVPTASVADQLRAIANRIDAGELGATVHSVTCVIDCDAGHVEVAFCGQSPLEGAHAHLMLAMGMRSLENID